MNERELKINKISQGLASLEDGLAWFDNATEDYRSKIMHDLDICEAKQAKKTAII